MFGFLRPNEFLPQWRRSYARVCQYQRRLFGLTSLPFLSFEAVFLYQLAADVGLIPQLDDNQPTCCRLRRLKSVDVSDDRIGSYAAAFGVVLAGVKLDDDVRDSGRIAFRLLRRKYRRQVEQARRILNFHAAGTVEAIDDAIQQHLTFETGNKSSLREYTRPTGAGFERAFAGASVEHNGLFASCGNHVGRSIIAWDCAVDFERDRITGDFTPLTSPDQVDSAFEFCLRELGQLGWKLPIGSVSGRLVAGVIQRVRRRMQSPVVEPLTVFERWGLVRQRGYTYANCDGCEAVCCVGEICGAGADVALCCGEAGGGASSCGGSPVCCCDAFICYECGQNNKKEQSKPAETVKSNPYAQYVNQQGQTVGLLNPMGTVCIDGANLAARSATGEMIDDGVDVIVVETDSFGVVVRESVSSV